MIPEGYELDPDSPFVDEGGYVEWTRTMARQRGDLLRMLLERGVEWASLSPLVETLSKHKRGCREIAYRWVEPVFIKLRKKAASPGA